MGAGIALGQVCALCPFLTFSCSGQVKRAVVQVISAMAHHGYLEQPGGEVMVDYIVQQCALPPEEVRTTTNRPTCF